MLRRTRNAAELQRIEDTEGLAAVLRQPSPLNLACDQMAVTERFGHIDILLRPPILTERYGQSLPSLPVPATPGDNAMFTKTTFGLAIILATASGAWAATEARSVAPIQNVYNPRGANVSNPGGRYLGTDPDANVRFELRRDWERGH